MNNKHLPVGILLFAALTVSCFAVLVSNNKIQLYSPGSIFSDDSRHQVDGQAKQIKDPFVNLKLNARAALVMDINTGEIIFAKNINERLPLASITKVMTMLVADQLIPLAGNTTVTMTQSDLKTEGDSGLKVGETWRLKDLIDFSLIVSSNDGASAIASVAGAVGQKNFVTAMNEQARFLHLDHTTFKNETGLDLIDNGGSGANGSAENVARLFAYIYKTRPELLEATKDSSTQLKPVNGPSHFVKNTNEVIDRIPGLLASKTGYTELSGGNLAIIFDRGLNQPAVAVVLNSTQNGRFTDMIQLVEASIISLEDHLNNQ